MFAIVEYPGTFSLLIIKYNSASPCLRCDVTSRTTFYRRYTIKCYNPKLTFNRVYKIICEYETCYPGTCNSKRSNRPSKPMKMTFLLFCVIILNDTRFFSTSFAVHCCLFWCVGVPQSFFTAHNECGTKILVLGITQVKLQSSTLR